MASRGKIWRVEKGPKCRSSATNVKGTFETFQFASTGSNAPYNEGRGQNLVVTEGTKKEKIPLLGFRRGMKIEQDTPNSDPNTRILFVTPQTVRMSTECCSALDF